MAIRKFDFTVKEDGITPAVEQRVGLQNEFKATQLVFNIEDGLYSKLLAAKGDNSLVYRFDCYNSAGGVTRLDTNPLENAAVTYSVGELISYPAKLRFESAPFISVEERESLSTLAEVAKNAAKRAAVAEAVATTAQGKTEQAQRALESDSEFFFDGGTSSGHAKTEFVIDSELSESSENLVENKAVALKFKSSESATNNELNKRELLSNKTNSFSEDIREEAAKQKYPSIKCLKDIPHIIESGTSGIWSYRKWSDGYYEAWYQNEEAPACAYTDTRGEGKIYLSPVGHYDFDLPAFNKQILNYTGAASANTNYSWGLFWVEEVNGILKFRVRIASFTQSATPDKGRINLHIIGKWK